MIRLALLATTCTAAFAAGCYVIGLTIQPTDRRAGLDALADDVTSLDVRTQHLMSVIDAAGRQTVRRNNPLSFAASGGADWDAR